MKVSDHGTDRMRERLGIPKKAAARMAEKALIEGTPHYEFSGSLRRYLDWIVLHDLPRHGAKVVRVYGQHVFLFGLDDTLVTAWLLPAKYKNKKAVVGE